MFNHKVTLLNRDESVDEYGNQTKYSKSRDVWADIRSVYASEVYEAGRVGMRPSRVFVLANKRDYHDEPALTYAGEIYDVIRSYENGSVIELTVQKEIGHNEH